MSRKNLVLQILPNNDLAGNFGWTDFDEIWHGDVEFNSKNNYRARFSIPDTVPDRWPKKCHF